MNFMVVRPVYWLLRLSGCPVIWEVSIGAVVFREQDGRRLFLLLHYPSGHFDFPRGHREAGETDEQTLVREVEEETGIRSLRIFPKCMKTRFFYVAKGTERERRKRSGAGLWIFKQVHLYPALTEADEVALSFEHTGFVWLPYDEALQKVTFENARRILRETEAYLCER